MDINLKEIGILKIVRRWRGIACLLLFLMIFPVGSGCYGKFPLTRGVYNFNGDITNDKFGRSIVMWIFIIIPVYGVAAIGDVLIFNLVQFWTGQTVTLASSTGEDGTRTTLTPSADGHEAILTISRNGFVLGQERIVRVSPVKCEMRGTSGRLDGTVVKNATGNLVILDRTGVQVAVLTGKDIAHLKLEANK